MRTRDYILHQNQTLLFEKHRIGLLSADKFASIAVIFAMYLYVYIRVWFSKNINLYVDADTSLIKFLPQFALTVLFLVALLKIVVSYQQLMFMTPSRIIVFVFLCIFAIFFYKVTGSNDFAVASVVGFALHKDKPDLFIVSSGVIGLVFFLIHLSGFYLGLITDPYGYVWIRDSSTGAAQARIALGFGQPNVAFAYLLPSCVASYYMKRSDLRYLMIVVCGVLTAFLYLVTGTRTILLISAFLLLNPFIERILYRRWGQVLSTWAFPILFVISIVGAFILQTRIGKFINSLLSGRPWLWKQYIFGGIKLIGPSATNQSLLDQKYPLDNLYLWILVAGGVGAFIVISILHVLMSRIIIKNQSYKLMVTILDMLVYGLVESKFQLGTTIYIPMLFMFILSQEAFRESGSN
jgi:hypothetical protein